MSRLGRSIGGTDLRLDNGTDSPVNDDIDVLDSNATAPAPSTKPGEDPTRSTLGKWLTPVALVVAILGAAALITRTGPAPVPPAPTTTTSPTSTTEPESTTEEGSVDPPLLPGEVIALGALEVAIPDVFVAPVAGGYLLLDPSNGVLERVSTGFDPEQIEAGSSGNLLALSEGRLERSTVGGDTWTVVADGVAEVKPSTTPGAVWITREEVAGLLLEIDDGGGQIQSLFNLGGDIDPRFRWEPGGGTFDVTDNVRLIGPHQLLAAGQNELLGRVCDARAQCRMELLSEGADEWEPLRRAQDNIVDARFNVHGTWVLLELDNRGVQLVSVDAGSTFIRNPSSIDQFHLGRFSTDGESLYLLTDNELEVITLETFNRRSIELPSEMIAAIDQWTVVGS